ncbi:type I restriction-modification system subunit M N-terminal domain-containing protein [Rhodomicrobium vannielii]|uniref:type I restriction-modification system subunit M N-terminal domain-containing protein n=1 Tax=Rhodomicrobium vannielii TaxID=1069 RepID=UPI0001C2459A
MLTGHIRSQIDQIWNTFWSGGVSNPLSVIEQITYLLFIKRLDELHTLEENKAQRLGKPIVRLPRTSIRRCSTASTSTTPCCASAR